MADIQKPRRRYSKSRTDLVIIASFLVIAFVLGWRHESPVAEITILSAFGIIGAAVGVYQAVGHLDLRRQATKDGEAP